MSSHVGHSIQKLIHSTPVFASVNDQTTTVVTNGGSVYQAGLIGNRIQSGFREIISNPNIVGHVIESASTDNDVYLLSSNGYVFVYDYDAGTCSPTVREVYSPAVCCGDKAVHIAAGRDHVLILTDHNKVWGAGDNSEYQLVPQGQCRYDVAVELLVTDTILHDDKSCCKFVGTLNELRKPHIPKKCDNVACVCEDRTTKCIGCLEINTVTVNDTIQTVSIPVWADYSFVAFLCVDKNGCVCGNLTLTLYRVFIKCGCQKCRLCDNSFEYAISDELTLFPTLLGQQPRVITSQITGKCGCEVFVTDLGEIELPTVALVNGALLMTVNAQTSLLTPLCGATITAISEVPSIELNVQIPVKLECCIRPCNDSLCEPSCLPQPCWSNIFAGSDISVLVDDCNRLYVFGSLHRVRNNKDLLKRSCLEDLLTQANASISLPADQLNCCVKPNNENCNCPAKSCKKFKTDLSTFRVNLKFDGCEDECCDRDCEAPNNVCDFLKALKQCNDAPACSNTCYPCDPYIYLNICDHCPKKPTIKCITLLNKRSVCKAVSQHCKDVARVCVGCESVIEFDLNRYCIDGEDFCLDKVICLEFGHEEGDHITLFVDLDASGGIRFCKDNEKCNVEFPVNASCDGQEFLLNYGSILDPVELTNLKFYLTQQAIFPCPQFKNPFDSKIINTYLNPGDRVCFIKSKHCLRHAVTADLPTVFRLNRRVLDVGVGENNLSVLVGGLACPNEIFAIGENCHGELGIDFHASTVCFKQVNRCWFDCQVVAVYGGKFYTLYITQSGKVYGAGVWKGLVNSDIPKQIQQVCQAWQIRHIAASSTHIIFVGTDGGIYGVGDNSLGELGLCHLDCVPCPHPLIFFHEFSRYLAHECREVFVHPVRRKGKCLQIVSGDCKCGCGCIPCVKCPECPPVRPPFELCPPRDCLEPCKPCKPKCCPPKKCKLNCTEPCCKPHKKVVYGGPKYIPNGRVVVKRSVRY